MGQMEWAWVMRGAAPVGAALLGGAAGALGAGSRPTATALAISFAAGAFLAAALLHLLPEAAGQAGWVPALLTCILGVAACAVLARWAGGFCPACTISKDEVGRTGTRGAGGDEGHPGPDSSFILPTSSLSIPLLIVIGIHSTLDGVALAHGAAPAAFGAIRPAGDFLSLAVLIHKIPEGMAVAAVCRASGMTAARAFVLTALVESLTLVGLAAGLWVGAAGGAAFGVALGLVAGSFLYLAWITFTAARAGTHPLLNTSAAAAGAVLIALARVLAG